ncbi:hypothetical protein ACT2FY_27965 [Paraburkholderia fungorum]|uniref:hypothetical protein n=1 Tax=Paraburkholderia fungorum TaxID=134537 RepID=UPI00402B464F
MLSKLIPGQQFSAIDHLVTEFVARRRPERGMVEKFIALKNEAGEVYRIIIADGVGEAIEADQFLVTIGCTEEPTGRYNSLFGVPPSR